MNLNYFKAVATDGTDFRTGKVHWLPADGAPIPEGGWAVEHPEPGQVGDRDAADYLSAATVETDCAGFSWPGRLLSVEPVGDVWTPHPDSFPHMRAAHAWRVVGELPAWRLFGPQERQVLDIIDRAEHLTVGEIEDLATPWSAAQESIQVAALVTARDAAYGASRGAALVASRGAARDAARDAARNDAARLAAWDADYGAAQFAASDAVLGWLVKDLISTKDFRTLTGPWEHATGLIEVTA